MILFPNRRLIWAFVAVYLLSGVTFGMAALALPVRSLGLGASPWLAGMIQAAIAVGLMVAILPAGFIVEKLGSRRVFIYSALGVGAMFLILPVASRPAPLLPLVMVLGCLAAFNAAAANAAFFSNLGEMGAEKAGWYKGAWFAGFSLFGPLLAGFALPRAGTAAVIFGIGAVWLVKGAAAVLFAPDRTGRESCATPRECISAPARMKSLLADRPLMGSAALEGIGVATTGVFTTFITITILVKFHLGPAQAALVIGLQGLGYALVLFSGAKVVGYFGRCRLAVAGLVAVAASFLVFAASPGIEIIAPTAFVLGLALGSIGLMNISPLMEASVARGPLVGFYGFGMHIFAAAGALTAGFVGKEGGIIAVFLCVPVIYLGVLALILLRRTPFNALFAR